MSDAVDGPVTQSPDTSPEVEALLVVRWRAMEPWEKVTLACELQRAADAAAVAGILDRHPSAGRDEVRLRLAALKHGAEFARESLHWDPDARGR
ncbi:MAG: hypothetical protein FJ296_03645 [Planctomycetes bacterium]|nr:hypothetical protein [Planctomycetota bacterium]